MKKIKVILSKEAEDELAELSRTAINSKFERAILEGAKKKFEFIKANMHYGEPIAKQKIPEEYKNKYGVTNLFWVELPNRWRMLYTLINGDSETEIVAFILDIIDHKLYDKKFKYKSF